MLSRFNSNKFGTDAKPFGEDRSKDMKSKQKLMNIKCNLIASKNFYLKDDTIEQQPEIDRQNC